MNITQLRTEFAAHIHDWPKMESNPEYGGTFLDYVFDWVYAHADLLLTGQQTFQHMETELKTVPLTWLPALLAAVVKECVQRDIFRPGGLRETVERAANAMSPTPTFNPASGVNIAANRFNFLEHVYRQREWSAVTFGPGSRAKGIIAHLRKELTELERAPEDLEEWIDIVTLGLDGAWRTSSTPEEVVTALGAKLRKNERRDWPDWRLTTQDQPIKHDRSVKIVHPELESNGQMRPEDYMAGSDDGA